MRVAELPAGDERRPLVGGAVAVGVPQEDRLVPVLHDGPAADDDDRGRDAQPLGEDGEAVGGAVAVGVFADADAVAARRTVGAAEFVRVVDRLADPQPAALVPRHRDRLGGEVALVGVEADGQPLRHDHVRQGLLRGERRLHERPRLRLRPPVLAGGVVRDLRADVDVLERRPVRGHVRHRRDLEPLPLGEGGDDARVVAAGPADAALQEITEAGVREGPPVVPPRGVEHAALAVGANPRPRFAVVAVGLLPADADREDGAVVRVVEVMDVGFVPRREAVEPGRDGVVRLDDRRPEHAGPVLQKLPADEGGHPRVVPPAIAGAVQRHEPAAVGDVVQHGVRPGFLDRIEVRV